MNLVATLLNLPAKLRMTLEKVMQDVEGSFFTLYNSVVAEC